MPAMLWPIFFCGSTITCSLLAIHPLRLWIQLSNKLKRFYLRLIFQRYAALLGRFAGRNMLSRVENRLKEFKVCCQLRAEEYLAYMIGGVAIGGCFTFLLRRWWWGPLFCILGYLLPELVLKLRLKKWKDAFCAQFPFAMDLLALVVDSGSGLQIALEDVAANLPQGPLRTELWRTLGHIYLGASFQEALSEFSLRSAIDEVKSFVTALVQAQQLGTKIEDVLNVLAENLRERKSQEAEERSQLLPLKMLVPLLLFIFPALLILLFGPFIVSGYLLF